MHKQTLGSTSRSRHFADALLWELAYKDGLITFAFDSCATTKSVLLQTVPLRDGSAEVDFNRESVPHQTPYLRRVP